MQNVKGKNLSNGFWVEAINTAVYLKNRSPTKSLEFKTPVEALLSFKSAIKHLRFFGSKDFAHVPKEDRKKLDSKAMKCTFVWYCIEFKSYKLFDPSTHKVFANIYVVFHEQVHGGNYDNNNEDRNIPLLMIVQGSCGYIFSVKIFIILNISNSSKA